MNQEELFTIDHKSQNLFNILHLFVFVADLQCNYMTNLVHYIYLGTKQHIEIKNRSIQQCQAMSMFLSSLLKTSRNNNM